MDNRAFFFQRDSCLLPQGTAVTGANLEIPLSDMGGLPILDRFTIPGIGGDGAISCVVVPPEAPLPSGWQAIPIRQALAQLPGPGYLPEGSGPTTRLMRAFHIAQWRQESLFCGSCGAQNTDATAELARLCPRCGRMEYPRISPAIIMLITNDEGKLLLAHNKKFAPGVYSLIAGFVEAGETIAAAAIREAREEVNIEVCDMQYIVSQPWPFPNSLTMGFSARYASGTLKPDGIEIEDARWFSRDSLPTLPGAGSMSRYLIEQWKNHRPPFISE